MSSVQSLLVALAAVASTVLARPPVERVSVAYVTVLRSVAFATGSGLLLPCVPFGGDGCYSTHGPCSDRCAACYSTHGPFQIGTACRSMRTTLDTVPLCHCANCASVPTHKRHIQSTQRNHLPHAPYAFSRHELPSLASPNTATHSLQEERCYSTLSSSSCSPAGTMRVPHHLLPLHAQPRSPLLLWARATSTVAGAPRAWQHTRWSVRSTAPTAAASTKSSVPPTVPLKTWEPSPLEATLMQNPKMHFAGPALA